MCELLQKDVILIDTDERSRNYNWGGRADKLDRNVQIVSIDEYIDKSEQLRKQGYDLPSLVDRGTVLIKDPFYSNIYHLAQNAEMAIYRNKYLKLIQILGLLGAKSFNCEVEIRNLRKRDIDAKGNVKFWMVDMDASMKKEEENKIKRSFQTETKWERTEYKTEDYEKAREIANNLKLNSGDVKSVIENRNPQGKLIESSRISFVVSEETQNLLDAAFTLKCCKFFSMSASFSETVSISKTVRVIMNVTFWPKQGE